LLKHLKIGKKLGVGFGAVLVLFAAAGLFGYLSFQGVRTQLAEIEAADANRAFMIEKEVDHLKWVNELNRLFLDDNVRQVTVQLDDHKCGFGKWLYSEETKALAEKDAALAQMLDNIKKPHNRLHLSAAAIGEVYQKENPEAVAKAKAILGSETKEALVETQGVLGQIRQHFLQNAQQASEATRTNLSSTTQTLLALLAAGLLVGTLGAIFISRSIARPVTVIARIAEAISRGDIQQTVTIDSRDETGQLAASFQRLVEYMKELAGAAEAIARRDLTASIKPRSSKDVLGTSFKTMIDNLKEMVRQLKDSADQVSSAASEIASSSEHMSKGARDQAEQVTQVSASVEQMAATILQSSRNAGEANGASQRASDTANSGGQVVTETIQGMQRIADVVKQSSESIGALAKSADQIGEIISVIDDIADQTNLLALNAAIEAARAGEQGRGFAVVADEVRKLAERTGRATREITDMIKGIQHDTSEAVKSMESGIGEVDRGRELADKAGNSLTEIVAMSGKVVSMIQQIAGATEEQSVAAEQIAKIVEHISAVTKETAAGAEQSAQAAEELSRNSEGLAAMVEQFKT
jgi:methyl-accepting chemotaxis protein